MITASLLREDDIREVTPAELPDLLKTADGVLWVDITGPTDEGIAMMRDVFEFHPLAIEDTCNQWQRPKIEEYADYLFVIINPAQLERDELNLRELDIFVGANYVVTVHGHREPVIGEVLSRVGYDRRLIPLSAGYLLYLLMDTTVDGYFPVLDTLEDRIDEIEDAILHNPHPGLVQRVFWLKRALVDLSRVAWPLRDILNALQNHNLPYIDQKALRFYLRDVSDHLFWVNDMLATLRDILTSLLDLYMTAISNRLNQIVNRLTVLTLAIGVLTVISGFFGMNFEQTWPPFSAPWGVPAVLALMAVSAGAVLLVLRWKRWY